MKESTHEGNVGAHEGTLGATSAEGPEAFPPLEAPLVPAPATAPAAPPAPVVGRSFLDLINLELRHGGQGAASVLAQDPARWLAGLGTILQSIKAQREARDKAFEVELARPNRGVDWPDVERNYRAWSRKILSFEGVVRLKIRAVRALVPADDVIALLEEGTLLNPRNREGVKAWQARAAAALQAYSRPGNAAPTPDPATTAPRGSDLATAAPRGSDPTSGT